MTSRYAHLSDEHKKKAVKLLDGLTGKGNYDKKLFQAISDV